MKTKEVEKIKVIKFTTEATLKNLDEYTGVMPDRLKEKATSLGIMSEEDQIWQYTGSDGNPETKFKLDICIPVKETKGDPGEFSFDELPAFKCVSEIHHGPWKEMGKTYGKIMNELIEKSIKFTGITREIYITCDFENQQNCVTEIQVAIK